MKQFQTGGRMRHEAGAFHAARRGSLMSVSARLRPRRRLTASAVVVGCALAMVLPSTAFASNDPLFSQQWGLAQIGAQSAWATSTGAGVKVGIVDTGVDLNHEDLAGQILATTNCIGANAAPSRRPASGQDDNAHGRDGPPSTAAATD